MRCDLHMHSRCSDGTLEVEALVEAVYAAGVTVFALTDHDTLEGLARAQVAATRRGLRLVSGVEISSRLDELELHILGYGFDVAHPGLLQALLGQREARRDRIPRIIEKLQGLGLAIEIEDVYREAGDATPGRPHVARALIARGYVRDMDEAFRRYLGDSGPAQIRKDVPTPGTAIAWIHAAGGKAVWAHPLARPIQRPGGFERLLRELKDAGLDGVEEVHPSQDPGARRRIRRLSRELGLKLTGGSDFHGEASPGVTLGAGRGHDLVPVSVVDELLG
jgi:predicted metal-dependent phosphoesterase TrpH